MTVQVVEGIVGAIQKRIDEYEEMANDLAHDYIQSDKPFPSDLKQRYETIGNLAEGLIEAIGIIMQGDYKRDDENKRLRVECDTLRREFVNVWDKYKQIHEALENIAWTYDDADEPRLGQLEMWEIARQALEGEHHEPSTD